MSLFSIITVCYNSEKTIKKCIMSVLEQSCEDYEYIIIDGASTDRTVSIIKKYEKLFKGKLKLISEKDNGIYDAMNKGIAMTSGRLVGFLNSDDYYEKDILKAVLEKYKSYDEYIYGNTKLVYSFDDEQYMKINNSVDSINRKTLQKGMGFVHQSSFVKKDVFNVIGKFNVMYKVGADWDFLIRCYNGGIKITKYNITISSFSKDGVSSKPHVIERHKIRKNNNLYDYFDMYLIKEIFNPASVIMYLFGSNTFLKCRKLYHTVLKKR